MRDSTCFIPLHPATTLSESLPMNTTSSMRRSVLFALINAGALLFSVAHARPVLESNCGGGIALSFVRACDAHSLQGYRPLRRQLDDGSCINMCCQQDANGNFSCVSDPSTIVSRVGGVPIKAGATSVEATPVKSPAPRTTTPAAPGVLPNSK
jgi:hypothetical protein